MVLASLATFFLVHYLSYATLRVEGKLVSDYIPFGRFLDAEIRSMSMEVRLQTTSLGATGELGTFGYLIAVLQIGGFAAGGLMVYGYLRSQPYCDKCLRYLSPKSKQVRYTADSEALKGLVSRILESLRSGTVSSAVAEQTAFGMVKRQDNDHLRSVVRVRHCKGCGQHWVRFTVEKRSGNDWTEIPELATSRFTTEVVNI